MLSSIDSHTEHILAISDILSALVVAPPGTRYILSGSSRPVMFHSTVLGTPGAST